MIGALVVLAAFLGNFHTRSMRQYRTLQSQGPGGELWLVEFTRDLEADSSGWRVSPNAEWSGSAFQAWLCKFFEPEYACDSVVVFVPIGAEKSGIDYVENLKGVSWIVLKSATTVDIEVWQSRFTNANVVSWENWSQMEDPPNMPY